MNTLQKGGLEPLAKVPNFKYTFNEERKLFIGYIYPYAEYFINCVTSIPFSYYTYNANCEYINFEDKTQILSQCSNIGSPLYLFMGGTVYEILNKRFNNVNMYNYCDATGDIDVTLYPPKLTYNPNGDVFFFNTNGKISSFYSNFTSWTFENMVKNIKSIQILFNNMDHVVNFDINEYNDIPSEHKNVDFGYNIQLLGKLYVVAFLNEDKTMFKIQVVCKIEDSGKSIIDHIIEIIIPLPEDNIEFTPSGDAYSQPSFNTITLNTQSFNISSYNSLINDNINAYIERKNAYGKSNEREVIHKSINHIARIFYLYELFYQNQSLFQVNKITLLFLFGMKNSQKTQLQFLYYYKIVNGKFNTIKVDTRFFLNSYLELILKNQYAYNIFKMTNPVYFINSADVADIKKIHDRFISELFNDDLFQPSGLLTFSETTGGKRSKRTRKIRRIHKKGNNPKQVKKSKKTRKNKTRKT
jgi:hypothetical protein